MTAAATPTAAAVRASFDTPTQWAPSLEIENALLRRQVEYLAAGIADLAAAMQAAAQYRAVA